MSALITDEQLINAIYLWNLSFFEGRMIATKEPKDKKKYKYLVKREATIKAQAKAYLAYWKDFKHSLYGTAFDYVCDNMRDFMEHLNPPKKKQDNTKYNKTPLIYD